VALYCSAPGVLVVGQVQARRERKRGFQVPGRVDEDVVREMGEWVHGVLYSSELVSSPRGWGLASPFIGQGGGELHARRAT
jgi:hypothetical protein